jgi:hypothetical protein
MGPIENYANPKAITGRAGLFPARYQSDRVDRPNGRLVRRANRALRAAILGIADNLMVCNRHFRALAGAWKLAGKNSKHSHVKVAARFCRIAFHLVAGRQVFRHPSCRDRGYILDKLLTFHLEHETPYPEILRDLYRSVELIPKKEHAAEAQPLADRIRRARTRGTATPERNRGSRAGAAGGWTTIEAVRGGGSRVVDPANASQERRLTPRGKPSRKAWRSLGSPTPDTAAWGPSSDVPVRRDGETHPSETAARSHRRPRSTLLILDGPLQKNRLWAAPSGVRTLPLSQLPHGSLFRS